MIKDTDTSQPNQRESLLSAFSHASILIPRIGFLVPMIIWIMQANQKNKSQYLTSQSFQALIYQVCIIIIGFIGNSLYILAGFIANIHLMFPVMVIGSIANVILIAYGVIGAIVTFQGKSFSYWAIGNQIKHFVPKISLKPTKTYIALIVFILIYLLITVAYFLLVTLGQSNA